ncbi:hypothetical protein RFI_12328 [Reticulomyxa filosa]|uniref:Aminomethyltransferase folate-binding domain-containing protein n=1 Tax=Reticulomyxa filosa TaxID=46433 RepID=X6NG02_RETFI|nr:hypothetical protein RFI_12328 [Reticulomyxa filosa]|eukprot:ETO24828.1 hypothetical protein RFI_12328 [Reticulomyxa filosa]
MTPLEEISVIRIHGKDSTKFLQGLFSNNINHLVDGTVTALYGAFLTNKGRFLYDAIMTNNTNKGADTAQGGDYVLEIAKDAVKEGHFIKHLELHKIRSKVTIEDISNEYRVWSLMCSPQHHRQLEDQICQLSQQATSVPSVSRAYIDPRCLHLGARVLVHRNDIPSFKIFGDKYVPVGNDFYDFLRCSYAIPKYGSDLLPDKSIILECNFNFINGVSFNKGCYVGQELIARTHHRGTIRKRIYPCVIQTKEDKEKQNGQFAFHHQRANVNDSSKIIPSFFHPKDITFQDAKDQDISVLNGRTGTVVGKVLSHQLSLSITQLRNEALQDPTADLVLSAKSTSQQDLILSPYLPFYMPDLQELLGTPSDSKEANPQDTQNP